MWKKAEHIPLEVCIQVGQAGKGGHGKEVLSAERTCAKGTKVGEGRSCVDRGVRGGGQSDWRGLGEVRLEKQVGSSQLLEVLTKDL